MIVFRLHRILPPNAATAAGLFIVGLLAGGSVRADTVHGGACPGPDLSFYASQSHATEEDIRRRCDLLEKIESDGQPVSQPLRGQILNELSNRFAVEMTFAGTIGMSGQAIDYLLENMPEAAILVSTYSDNEYRAAYIAATEGPERFFVTNNRTFWAAFTYLLSRISPDVSEHVFFESGQAKVLFWKLWGNSFVQYNLRKNDEAVSRYEIRIHVFTESRLLRTILNSRLFRYFAHAQFKNVLDDIEVAVHEFTNDSNPGDVLPLYFVKGLKMRLHGDDASIATP